MKIVADDSAVRTMRVALHDRGDQFVQAGRRPFPFIAAHGAVVQPLVAAGDAAVTIVCNGKKDIFDRGDRGVASGHTGAPVTCAQPRGQPFRRILPAQAHLGVSPGRGNQVVT